MRLDHCFRLRNQKTLNKGLKGIRSTKLNISWFICVQYVKESDVKTWEYLSHNKNSTSLCNTYIQLYIKPIYKHTSALISRR